MTKGVAKGADAGAVVEPTPAAPPMWSRLGERLSQMCTPRSMRTKLMCSWPRSSLQWDQGRSWWPQVTGGAARRRPLEPGPCY